MTKFALYVPLQAKPGKEKDVADFLRSAVPPHSGQLIHDAAGGTWQGVSDSLPIALNPW